MLDDCHTRLRRRRRRQNENDYERQSSVIHHPADYDDEDSRLDDDESRYSSPMSALENEEPEDLNKAVPAESLPSPVQDDVFSTPTQGHDTFSFDDSKMSLPPLNSFLAAAAPAAHASFPLRGRRFASSRLRRPC